MSPALAWVGCCLTFDFAAYGLGEAASRHATITTQAVIGGSLRAGLQKMGTVCHTVPDSVAFDFQTNSHTGAIQEEKLPSLLTAPLPYCPCCTQGIQLPSVHSRGVSQVTLPSCAGSFQ